MNSCGEVVTSCSLCMLYIAYMIAVWIHNIQRLQIFQIIVEEQRETMRNFQLERCWEGIKCFKNPSSLCKITLHITNSCNTRGILRCLAPFPTKNAELLDTSWLWRSLLKIYFVRKYNSNFINTLHLKFKFTRILFLRIRAQNCVFIFYCLSIDTQQKGLLAYLHFWHFIYASI